MCTRLIRYYEYIKSPNKNLHVTICATNVITYMKKLHTSNWLKTSAFSCNTMQSCNTSAKLQHECKFANSTHMPLKCHLS